MNSTVISAKLISYKLLLFILVLMTPSISYSYTQGDIPLSGNFNVDGGSANYSLPILISPGRAGFFPKISIDYNSNIGNSSLGMGWQLNASSVITRCGQNVVTDKLWGQVKFDENDKYCLDGKRLIAVKGQVGSHGTEYRLETNGYSKVISSGLSEGGPSYFTAWNKSGEKFIYGDTNDSKVELPGTKKVYKWALNKRVKHNNSINYVYVESVNGHYLSSINYVGGEVLFDYQARNDKASRYLNAAKLQRNMRLAAVRIINSTGVETGKYNLTYGYSGATERSLLKSITYCAQNNCSAPIVFYWTSRKTSPLQSKAETLMEPDFIDVNRDGLFSSFGRVSGSKGSTSITVKHPNGVTNGPHPDSFSLIGSLNNPTLKITSIKSSTESYTWGSEGKVRYRTVYTMECKNLSSYMPKNDGVLKEYCRDKQLAGDFNGDGKETIIPNYVNTHLDLNGDGSTDLYTDLGALDLNGDGLTDLYTIDKGHIVFKLSGIDNNFKRYNAKLSDNSKYQFVDINNDGYLDLVKTTKGIFEYINIHIFNGVQFFAKQTIQLSVGDANNDDYLVEFADMNSDGYPDLYYNGKFYRNRFGNIDLTSPLLTTPTAENIKFLDINSDGWLDIIATNGNVTTLKKSSASVQDKIFFIEEMSKHYKIHYKPLVDSSVHTQKEYYHFPFMNRTPQKYVVSKVIKGAKGYLDTYLSYHYQGAKSHYNGGGFLGFSRIIETESNEGTTITTRDYEQLNLISAGRPIKTTVSTNSSLREGGIKKFTEKTFTYQINSQQGTSAKYHQVYADTITSKLYTLENSQIEKQTVEQITKDKLGNITHHISTLSSALSNQKVIKSTKNTYLSSVASYWQLSALKSTTESLKDSSSNLTRTTSQTFTYYSNGLLKNIKNSALPYESGGIIKTKEQGFIYDSYGNVIKQTYTGTGVAERISVTKYSNNGLFPSFEINHLGHKTALTYDSATGNLAKSIDPNNRVSSWFYDPLGRIKRESKPGIGNYIEYNYLTGSACSQLAGLRAVNCIIVSAPNQGTTTTAFDYAGNEIYNSHQAFNGEKVIRMTTWDKRGRKISVSRPQFFTGSDAPMITFTYDERDREITKTEPTTSGSTATFKTRYAGLTTIFTNARRFTQSITKNVNGQITTKSEPLSASQTYTYYPDGKLRTSRDSAGNTTKVGYDNLGFRRSLDDPDMGKWTYNYNVLGELLSKTDANNKTTNIVYDGLGRKVEQHESDNVSKWVYDTKAIGRLSSHQGYGNTTHYNYNASGLVKSVTLNSKGESFTTNYLYDNYERLISESRTNGSGSSDILTLQYLYNKMGYMSAVRSPKTAADAIFSSVEYREDIAQLMQQALSLAKKYVTKANAFQQQQSFYTQKAAELNAKKVDLYELDTSSEQLLSGNQRYKKWCDNRNNCYLKPSTWVLLHGDVSVPIEIISETETYRFDSEYAGHATGYNLYDVTVHSVTAAEFNAATLIPQDDLYLTDYDKNGLQDLVSSQQINGVFVDAQTSLNLAYTGEDFYQAISISSNQYQYYTDLAKQLVKLVKEVASLSGIYCQHADTLAGDQNLSGQQCQQTQLTSQYQQLSNLYDASVNDAAQNDAYIYYWQRTDSDAYDHTLSETLGNGLANTYVHNKYTGRPEYISTHKASQIFDVRIKSSTQVENTIRQLHYRYDNHNNVTMRHDSELGIIDSFWYDALDRLSRNTIRLDTPNQHGIDNPDFKASFTFAYDKLGNITKKSDLGSYHYSGNQAGPHAVTNANGFDYQYDAVGNMLSAKRQGDSKDIERELRWSHFNKPTHITRNGKTVEFKYDANHNRYYKKNSDGLETFYFGKSYERTKNSVTGEVQHKHFIYADGKLIALNTQIRDNDNKLEDKQIRYLHYDALGSVDMISDGYGAIVERRSFDPWGKKRSVRWQEGGVSDLGLKIITNRGFTGHEHIEEIGLIHMNGRVYDQQLGRFISADPIIQSPFNTNSFNRYSYVTNNPLKYTDPTGFVMYENGTEGRYVDSKGNHHKGDQRRSNGKDKGKGNPLNGLGIGAPKTTEESYFESFSQYTDDWFKNLVSESLRLDYSAIGLVVHGMEPEESVRSVGMSLNVDYEQQLNDIGSYAIMLGSVKAVVGRRTVGQGLGVANSGRKLWGSSTTFKGNKVFQRNDLIDPKLVDARGRTNLERMQKGLAPVGPDGKSVNLHHMTQRHNGSIAEVTQTFHQKNSRTIHINSSSTPSGIDRPAFNKWRTGYWKSRRNDF